MAIQAFMGWKTTVLHCTQRQT